MSSKLFEEAVADAKKLRYVAEENAKKAILEAVTPRIREFIEGQLMEDDHEDDSNESISSNIEEIEGDLDEEIVLNEDSLKSLIKMLGGEKILNSLSEGKDVVDASVKQALSNLSKKERTKLLNLADKINQSANILENKKSKNNIESNQENKTMSNSEKFYEVDLQALREAIEEESIGLEGIDPEDMMEAEEEEENEGYDSMELDELMNEIRLVLDLGDEVEGDDLPEMLRGMIEEDEAEDMDLEMEDEDADLDTDEEDDEEDDDEDPAAMFGDEEEQLAETFEIDPKMLRQELSRVRRMIREGNVADTFGGKGDAKAGIDGSFGGKGKKNAGVKGAFGGGSEGQDPFVNPPQINKLNEAIRKLRRQNRSQTEKLNKYRGAVNTLREQLEDLNLFNAKLLYVNKLLQNKALTESQKKSVIKALDEANSLVETKALYKSLTESLGNSRKASINESVRYGSSSKTTTSAGSKRTDTGDLGRWQRLAGLK